MMERFGDGEDKERKGNKEKGGDNVGWKWRNEVKKKEWKREKDSGEMKWGGVKWKRIGEILCRKKIEKERGRRRKEEGEWEEEDEKWGEKGEGIEK